MTQRGASRCTVPQATRLEWHYYREPDGTKVVAIELSAAFPDSLTRSQRIGRMADLRELLDAAADGLVPASDEGDDPPLKEVRRDPSLWELRWTLEDGSKWRMYHGEPVEAPGYLIALRFHRKWTKGTKTKIRSRQNIAIDEASRRFRDGRSHLWGLP